MTKDGLTAKQLAEVRKRETAEARANTAMMHRAAGYQYEANLARSRENARRKRAAGRAA